jgi:hypothetical protein
MPYKRHNQTTFDLPSATQLLDLHLKHWKDKNPELFVHDGSTKKIPQITKAIQQINQTNNLNDYVKLLQEIEVKTTKSIRPQSIPYRSALPNEFIAIFDLQKFKHIKIDAALCKTLGIKSDDFNLKALAGMDARMQLHHHEDVQHVVKWATLAYSTIHMNIFRWKLNEDVFRINFRASAAFSHSAELRESKYVYFEKSLLFMRTEDQNEEVNTPAYLLNKVSLLPSQCFQPVSLHFVGAPIRANLINGFIYLLNLFLLGVPIKYILFLHERSIRRSIAEAANSINTKINKYHQVSDFFTEKQISDCLQKSVRRRISQVYSCWNRNSKNRIMLCESDSDAIECAKLLGLLPIPLSIEHLLYQNSSIQNMTH